MTNEDIECLDRLRYDIISKAIENSEIKSILCKYFKKGTKIEIDKDSWTLK